jgi:putative endonuclease
MEKASTKKQHNKITGARGEQIVVRYLQNKGFAILGQNYLKKWGEIDIIVKKDERIHFVEVKTVSYETKHDLERAVAYGTWRPEENVHAYKVKKLSRAIESWILEYNWRGDWQIDVAAVRIVPRETYATVKYLDNVIIN